MKKTYMSPRCEEIKINSRCTLLNGSSITAGDLVDVEYGGVDTSGTLEPDARQFDFEYEEYEEYE